MASVPVSHGPLFSAVSSSARQLYSLLRCIGFASKAQVQITEEGLRFTVEESRVMQGFAFLEKTLFTTFSYVSPRQEEEGEEEIEPPTFQISLSALLETLQIFGINDSQGRWASRDNAYSGVANALSRGAAVGAFDNHVLGMNGVCRLSYAGTGEALCIILEETGVTTTCELVTYEPEMQEDIPLQRNALAQKIIMRASWLFDAITELSSTSPSRLTISASPTAPYFTLSAAGALGSATVEFSKDAQLLETFQVPQRTANTYKYSLIKHATRAMAVASKVSIRGDEQGVLSLQFMIELDGGGVSFVDFRFVPLMPEEGEEDDEEENGETQADEELGEDESSAR